MSASRSESQHPRYGRGRSNTTQSIVNTPPTPLRVGDSRTLNAWVDDSTEVVLNPTWWPGVAEGDLLRVTANFDGGFLFIVTREDGPLRPQLQVCIPKPIADTFGLRNNSDVVVTKVDKRKWSADYIELIFQDQYLGRNDMWRLGNFLVGQCVYAEQEVPFLGTIAAKIRGVYIGGKKVSAGYVTSSTKAIYRSLSAKVTIFIQVCRELWEFAEDGECYNEKIVHSFLPALFAKWREAGTNHTVTIILISRVFYDESETTYAAGPLRCDEEGRWYKDFYKVITDLEVVYEWKPMLFSLKDSFLDFQRDILLTHHHHRAKLECANNPADNVRLVGRLSFAHDGPILEALNLGLTPTETHYIDRSLSSTGVSTLIITPGTGHFRVSKQLLRLTTTRMLDQGFGVDLVCLTKAPLHQSPIMSFQGFEPGSNLDKDNGHTARSMDPLWGGDDDAAEASGRAKTTFWWEPFWMTISHWDKQMDLPFRNDRFIARAKMHEVQMLGLLRHDVRPSIEIPFLPDHIGAPSTPTNDRSPNALSASIADAFDLAVFSVKSPQKAISRQSSSSSATGTIVGSYRSSTGKTPVNRLSMMPVKLPPIEGSPRPVIAELPPENLTDSTNSTVHSTFVSNLSTSPSHSSTLSVQSNSTASSTNSQKLTDSGENSIISSISTSRFAPGWFFKRLRSAPAAPQATPVFASVSTRHAQAGVIHQRLHVQSGSPSVVPTPIPRPPQPMMIKNTMTGRSTRGDAFDDEIMNSFKPSPMNTPRGDVTLGKRRPSTIASLAGYSSNSPPNARPNPSRPRFAVSPTQSSLARRWQHMFPLPLTKHEVKWRSMVTPGCLPLTTEYFPSMSELESSYDVSSWNFVIDPREMRSFLVSPPPMTGDLDQVRRAWARVVMRGMAAVRLAQGFQIVLRPSRHTTDQQESKSRRRGKPFLIDDDMTPTPAGAAEVLDSNDPIFLSMSNEIHRISCNGETIQVRRYVRRMSPTTPFYYQCLIWPKLGVGYTELKTSFLPHGLENYGWNRLDMLIAGYEYQFNDSLRYWRTRFVVIPTTEPPQYNGTGISGEKFSDEEIRLLGIDKLAELFTKLRWRPPDERSTPTAPVRFLPTTLSPETCVLDDVLVAQLDEIHATGPLRKKVKSDREIADLSLSAMAKLMREEDGLRIKNHRWHTSQYPDSFTGFDFVSWLVREFKDVSSRAQAAEWGVKLLEQGLFEHCRGYHGFMDGHYFYRLKSEYAVPMTPRGWFRSARREEEAFRPSHLTSNSTRRHTASPRRHRKQLILSQTMIIDVDPNKRSDQAETVFLHHDIIHNPGTIFHFELQWIGATARSIDDQLRQWSRSIERYGLKLVEAYVAQICDVRERNAFQSCFPIRLEVPPPVVPDLAKRVPEGMRAANYFEVALLQRFGFVLDVEAADLYPEQVDVVYSYRRSPHKYAQYVHRSGMAFVQVLGGTRGFLYLTNRLVGPGRMGAALKSKEYRPTAASDEIRIPLTHFCSDAKALANFYDEQLSLLGQIPPEEPPPLSI